MVEQLFGSKTRVKLLNLFYSNPNRSFYVREITRKVDEQINSVRRELSNLLSIGIITSDTNNNKLYYEVNQQYAYYHPLSAIFGNTKFGKTTAVKLPAKDQAIREDNDPPIVKSIRSIGKIDLALLTGQFTRDESAGVDLLLVGDTNQTKVSHFVSELEKQENKEVRYVVMNSDEYKYRLQVNDRFAHNILAAKKQVLINDTDLPVNQN